MGDDLVMVGKRARDLLGVDVLAIEPDLEDPASARHEDQPLELALEIVRYLFRSHVVPLVDEYAAHALCHPVRQGYGVPGKGLMPTEESLTKPKRQTSLDVAWETEKRRKIAEYQARYRCECGCHCHLAEQGIVCRCRKDCPHCRPAPLDYDRRGGMP